MWIGSGEKMGSILEFPLKLLWEKCFVGMASRDGPRWGLPRPKKKKKILVGKIFPKKEKKKDLEPPYFVAQAPLQKS